jgi:hypothetical protein
MQKGGLIFQLIRYVFKTLSNRQNRAFVGLPLVITRYAVEVCFAAQFPGYLHSWILFLLASS